MARQQFKTILLFFIVLLVAYLPISSFLFFLKNDAFTGYFPPKFYMSESIAAGHLPLWNPYINFGFPQYGDMSAAYWSPVTWLIASTIGYTAYSFTAEVLMYLLLSGIGMYTLCKFLGCQRTVCLIAGISYMCCGFQTGHLQHFNWLSGTAYLPWIFWAYVNMVKAFNVRSILIAVLAFYFFISSAHPGLIIAAVYFFIALGIYFFAKSDKSESFKIRGKKFLITHGIFILLLLLLSAGMIAGYYDIIPWITRGGKISLADSLLSPTTLNSWISLLLPFATTKNDVLFHTDISMRNCYIGLFSFSLFIVFLTAKKDSLQKFLFITGSLFALLACGGIFKTISYHFLPFIGYVRLNGEFRIYALFCFIILGALQFEKIIDKKNYKPILVTLNIILWVISGVFLFAIASAVISQKSLIVSFFTSQRNLSTFLNLKNIIDQLTFYDTILIQAPVQLGILYFLIKCFKKDKLKYVLYLVMADMILATLMNVPYTGAGNTSVASIQKIINTSPPGLPIPPLIPINDLKQEKDKTLLVGDWSMYNKNIGTQNFVPYPIVLNTTQFYFDSMKTKQTMLSLKPYAYLKDSSGMLQVNSFSGSSISFNVNIYKTDTIIFLQNWFPHWEDGNGENLQSNNEFISIPVTAGINKAQANFRPTIVLNAMLLSFCLFVTMLLTVLIYKPKFPSLS